MEIDPKSNINLDQQNTNLSVLILHIVILMCLPWPWQRAIIYGWSAIVHEKPYNPKLTP